MAQFASKTRNTDPAPYVIEGVHADMAALQKVWPGATDYKYAPRPKFAANTTPVNPILEAFRDEWASEPSAYTSHEWLYHLARHWGEWQSPRIGTFPIPGTYVAGSAVTREESEESGEDRVYWEIADALAHWTGHDEAEGDLVDYVDLRDAGRIQDAIVHAVAVLDRLDEWATANGRGI